MIWGNAVTLKFWSIKIKMCDTIKAILVTFFQFSLAPSLNGCSLKTEATNNIM
jgi:hypothetical protein